MVPRRHSDLRDYIRHPESLFSVLQWKSSKGEATDKERKQEEGIQEDDLQRWWVGEDAGRRHPRASTHRQRLICEQQGPGYEDEGQLAAGTCEIVTLDRDSSQPRRTIARQTARCACKKGQIAGTTRARPACVDAKPLPAEICALCLSPNKEQSDLEDMTTCSLHCGVNLLSLSVPFPPVNKLNAA
ncbi:hypothetical protein NQZ68_011408 [Dissostichus eleginoides]|nr:hypothetical protein NQZ68_011408 [Dissostichus eleginoides]